MEILRPNYEQSLVSGSSFYLVNSNYMEVWLMQEIWNGTNIGEEIKQSFLEASGELNLVLPVAYPSEPLLLSFYHIPH